MQIKFKVALVTGANRGIGRAFVEELIKRGAAKVYAGARDVGRLEELVQRHKGKVEAIKLDITKPEDIAAAAKKAPEVSLLVNNAGINLQAGIVPPKCPSAARALKGTTYSRPPT